MWDLGFRAQGLKAAFLGSLGLEFRHLSGVPSGYHKDTTGS